jgi:hypothetical protein
MKKLILTATLLLCACASNGPAPTKTVPFPVAPSDLTQSCPNLDLVDKNTTKLSDALIIVTRNYTEYYECKLKTDEWIEWYNNQKKIWDGLR